MFAIRNQIDVDVLIGKRSVDSLHIANNPTTPSQASMIYNELAQRLNGNILNNNIETLPMDS